MSGGARWRDEAIMTDAGGFLPGDDATGSGERARLLGRIAEALKLPLSAFLPSPGQTRSAEGPSADECAAMLAAFSRIRDPDLRRHCLRMLERCADG